MRLPTFLRTPPPDLAVGIDAGHVAAAALAWNAGRPRIAAYAAEPLPAGAVLPSLSALNLIDPDAVGGAVRRAVDALGHRAARAALVLPDTAAKVSLIRFAQVPARAAELHEMLRWQVRKSAPFPIDEAVVSATPGIVPPEGGREFVVTVARRDIVAQYEAACTAAGLEVGLVDLASFSVINAVLAGPSEPAGDWLLVHVTPTYTALAVVRGADLIFIRNRTEGAEGTLPDLVHQTTMYYEDRLAGSGFSQVRLAGSSQMPTGLDELRRQLEDRLHLRVDLVDVRETAEMADRIDAPAELLDRIAPLAGLLLREHRAA